MITKKGFGYSLGVSLILTGLILLGRVTYDLNRIHQAETSQDRAWQQFSVAAQGAAPAASPAPSAPPSPTATPDDELPNGIFLKMTLPAVSKDAVAVNGDWNSLKTFNTVHYKDSPGPGQKGNMLIAFHREPKWVDFKVQAGDIIQIEALDHMTYEYKVEYARIVGPADVNGLKATTGTDLTLVTCDPPWQDYHRMVVRAHLVRS